MTQILIEKGKYANEKQPSQRGHAPDSNQACSGSRNGPSFDRAVDRRLIGVRLHVPDCTRPRGKKLQLGAEKET